MPTIVVDANIMASALMGTSLPLLADVALRADLVAPIPQFAETRKVLYRLDQPDVERRMAELAVFVEPLDGDVFADFEADARLRLYDRGQSDWPVLAAALALDAAIWTRDPDLFGTGVAVWSTRNIIYAAREIPA